MKLRLLVIGPNNRTYSHMVYQPSIRVGSSADCEVVIPTEISPLVSRYHALIDLTDDGVFITDFDSTNGTFLNGMRLTERTQMQPADEVRLGQQGPILRAFLIDEQPDAEGTIQESARPREPVVAARAHVPPPPPPVTISPPPPLPTARAAAPKGPPPLPSRRDSRSRRDESLRDDDDASTLRPARRSMNRTNQTYLMIGGGVVLAAALVGILIWQFGGKKKSNEPEAPLSSEEIYKRSVASATYIEIQAPGKVGSGTGSLIDRERKLVLTAYHVIDGATDIKVLFPKYDKDGKAVGDRREYRPADMINAKVWKSDSTTDLAILVLDSIPANARVAPLASASPDPGEEVHTVGGSPRGSIGLWIYSKGNVREVQQDNFILDTNQRINSWVIRATNPIAPGDSGGGLINKKCELVGVCCAINNKADLVRVFIDIREVKNLLNSGGGAANDKKSDLKPTGSIDPAKLIGRWANARDPFQIEFTRDGRLILVGGGKSIEGRYRLVNDKLTLTITVGGKEDTDTMTVKLLTDDRLVTIDDKGKEDELRRVK